MEIDRKEKTNGGKSMGQYRHHLLSPLQDFAEMPYPQFDFSDTGLFHNRIRPSQPPWQIRWLRHSDRR
ncbi:hypothetical protein [Paenibacillus sp. CECT 9249]|uniref:hypothetical protein n=1 Tax=Paenibacillus sp. CECT 9249 TaxID=2845385 RepID=UPI001E2DC047|nr:hypothetical protein [Paenibacillus sp. CECT 9249]